MDPKRCGPKFMNTVCTVGWCSSGGKCVNSIAVAKDRPWGVKFDSTAAATYCWGKGGKGHLKKVALAVKYLRVNVKTEIAKYTRLLKTAKGSMRAKYLKVLAGLKKSSKVSASKIKANLKKKVVRQKKAQKLKKALKKALKCPSNVHLNTNKKIKGSKPGRCGPKFGNTMCVSGYCSQWSWCGFSRLHKNYRHWKNPKG